MERIIHLDTHVVLWLYGGEVSIFSKAAIEAIEKNDIAISSLVELELKYLHECDRISVNPVEIINALTAEIGLRKCNNALNRVVSHAIQLDWTRDPFDRLIVSEAAIDQIPFLTKDRTILSNYALAFWERFTD